MSEDVQVKPGDVLIAREPDGSIRSFQVVVAVDSEGFSYFNSMKMKVAYVSFDLFKGILRANDDSSHTILEFQPC